MDNIHVYLYHLWDYGYRSRGKYNIKNSTEKTTNDFVHDPLTISKYQIISPTNDCKDGYTFIDHFCEVMSEQEVGHIIETIEDEEYDTDAIDDDIGHELHDSNIYILIKDKMKQMAVSQHIHELKGMRILSCIHFIGKVTSIVYINYI